MPIKVWCSNCHGDGIQVFHGVVGTCEDCNGTGYCDEETPEEHRAFVNKVAGAIRDRGFKVITASEMNEP